MLTVQLVHGFFQYGWRFWVTRPSPRERLVLVALGWEMGTGTEATVSQVRLARYAGMSASSVRLALRGLCSQDILEFHGSPGRCTRYALTSRFLNEQAFLLEADWLHPVVGYLQAAEGNGRVIDLSHS